MRFAQSGISRVAIVGSIVAALAFCVLSLAVLTKSEALASGGGDSHGDSAVHVPDPPIVNWTDLGYADKNAHGDTRSQGEAPMAPPMLFAILNFAIFAGIIYWKAGPALRKYLANRHVSIKDALKEAAKLQEEAKEKLEEYSARIADADTEVKALIAQIRQDAEEEKQRLIADAEKQADRVRKDAEARIESEFLTARRRLEREIVAKAAEAAEKALQSGTTTSDHSNLFSAFITDLKSDNSASHKGRVS